MGLQRDARRHDTVGLQRLAGVNAEDYRDFQPGQRVMTVDGFPGRVKAVADGFTQGAEEYHVTLDNGMGGGRYTAGQLQPMAATTADRHTAADDYPELQQILIDRPDPARIVTFASARQLVRTAAADPGQCLIAHSGPCPDLSEHTAARHQAMPARNGKRPPGYYSTIHRVGDEPKDANDEGIPHVLTGHMVDPDTGAHHLVGHLSFGKSDDGHALKVFMLHTAPGMTGQGAASAMMDDLYAHHPDTWINHGERTNEGVRWWNGYREPEGQEHQNVHNQHPLSGWNHYWNPHEVASEMDVNHERDRQNLEDDHPLEDREPQHQPAWWEHEHDLGTVEHDPHDNWRQSSEDFDPEDEYDDFEDEPRLAIDAHGMRRKANMPGQGELFGVDPSQRVAPKPQPKRYDPDEDEVDPADKPEYCDDCDEEHSENDGHRECTACGERHQDIEDRERHETAYTDWDQHYPGLADTLHRGMEVHLDPDEHNEIHDPSIPVHRRAWKLSEHLAGAGLGMHWTENPEQAEHYSITGGNHPVPGYKSTHVVVHARTPERHQIETDPDTLADRDVYGMGFHDDEEIPIREDEPLTVTGFSWKRPEDADWTHHTFRHPINQHVATTINHVKIDDHGDSPHEVRASDPNSYDDRSTEGDPDPVWTQPVHSGDREKALKGEVQKVPANVTIDGDFHTSAREPKEDPAWAADDLDSAEFTRKHLDEKAQDLGHDMEWHLEDREPGTGHNFLGTCKDCGATALAGNQSSSSYTPRNDARHHECGGPESAAGHAAQQEQDEAGMRDAVEEFRKAITPHYRTPQMPDAAGATSPVWGGADFGPYMHEETRPYEEPERADRLTPSRLSKLFTTAALDDDFRFHVVAHWRDVQAKAKRIRSEGKVHIVTASDGVILGQVQGDHHTYETGIQRLPGSRQGIATYSCGCKWGAYHWGANDDFSRFAGRMCSHALALQYEAQSRGMFGRQVQPNTKKPGWLPDRVVVKYDIDDGQNIFAHSGLDLSPVELALKTAYAAGESPQTLLDLLASAKIAAANDPFGGANTQPVVTQPTPLGATSRPDPYASPASAGFLSGPDPKDWGSIGDTPSRFNVEGAAADTERFTPGLANDPQGFAEGTEIARHPDWLEDHPNGAEAILHDEPEPALPSTDGEVEHEGLNYGTSPDDLPINSGRPDISTGHPEDLSPQNTEIQLTGADGGGDTSGFIGGDDLAGDEATPDGVSPEEQSIVAAFQRSAGGKAIMAGAPTGQPSQASGSDIAAAAREHLAKEGMKDFTAMEQAELINEGATDHRRASNFDRLNIQGTHYEALPEDEDELWLS